MGAAISKVVKSIIPKKPNIRSSDIGTQDPLSNLAMCKSKRREIPRTDM